MIGIFKRAKLSFKKNRLALLKSLPKELERNKQNLDTLTNELNSAKAEVEKPFDKKEELDKKTERLTELNILLSLDSEGSNGKNEENDDEEVMNSEMDNEEINDISYTEAVSR